MADIDTTAGTTAPMNSVKKPLTLACVNEVLTARFVTANGIPVERATIRAAFKVQP